MATHQDRAFDDLRNALQEYARILRSRWQVAVLGLGLVSGLAFWCSQYVPRQYRASTIFERRDDVVLRNLLNANSPYSFDHLKSTIQLDMTGSRALANATMTSGLLPPGTFTGDGALTEAEMRVLDRTLSQRRIKPAVRLLHSSTSLDTIELVCEAADPAVAQSFVTALRERYIHDTRERITEILRSCREFFAGEVTRYDQKVAALGNQLKAKFADFPGIDPTDLNALGERLEAMRRDRADVQARQLDLAAQISAREEFLAAGPPDVGLLPPLDGPAPPPSLAANPQLEREIEQVQGQLNEALLVRRMTEEHPAVKALLRKLESLKDARDALAAAAVGRALPSGQAIPEELRQWNAQRARIELELDALRKQFAAASERYESTEARVARFEGLYDDLREDGDTLRQWQEQTAQDAATAGVWRQHLSQLDRILAAESGQRGTGFTLIEAPKEVGRPLTPRVTAIFAICLGLGLAVATLLIATTELLDRSFRSAAQVTRVLGLPVLESIGVIDTPRERRRRRVGQLLWAPALCLVLAGLVLSAGLAYASLERPELHAQLIAKLRGLTSTMRLPLAMPPTLFR